MVSATLITLRVHAMMLQSSQSEEMLLPRQFVYLIFCPEAHSC